MLLTIAQILAVDDLKFEDVEVPEWSGTIRVRTMTGTARDELGRVLVDSGTKMMQGEYDCLFLSKTMVNEDGTLACTPDQVAALGAKNPFVIARIAEAARRLNKVDDAAVDSAEKNS